MLRLLILRVRLIAIGTLLRILSLNRRSNSDYWGNSCYLPVLRVMRVVDPSGTVL